MATITRYPSPLNSVMRERATCFTDSTTSYPENDQSGDWPPQIGEIDPE
jgi:hypothetical protein